MEFWELTPFELNLIIKTYAKKKEEESKEMLSMVYINAMWTAQWFGKKSSHPRPLKEILESIDKDKKQMSDEDMFEKVKALNALFGGEVKEDYKKYKENKALAI